MQGKLAFISDLLTFVVKKSLLHDAMVTTFLDDNKSKTSLNGTVSNSIDVIYFQYTFFLSFPKRNALKNIKVVARKATQSKRP